MKALVCLCAAKPVGVIMTLLAILLAGVMASTRLPLGRLPEISVPRIIVEALMPGLPASEIRTMVAMPLEDALASAKGLMRSSSISHDGRAVIGLDFAWGEDILRAAGRVREILDSCYPSLPEGASKPVVLVDVPDREPLLVVSLLPRNSDLVFARRLAEHEVKARLRRVDGVGTVNILGGFEREAIVVVDMRRAALRGLTVYDLARAVSAESADTPSGSLREGNVEYVALAHGSVSTVEELGRIVALGPNGAFRISELATISERDAPRQSLFVANGEECVALELYRKPGADPVATAKQARIAIGQLITEFGRDVEIVIQRDSSLSIATSIKNLAVAGIAGALIAAAVLFLLLGNLKAGLLVAGTIPVAIAATLAVLFSFGRSLNSMSLGGISLAVGMISDNAVVVLDALTGRFSAVRNRPGAVETSAVVATVLSGTLGSMLTTAVVFIPVFFLPGAIGGLFGDLAISIIIANTAGWFIAVLALPAIYRIMWTRQPERTGLLLESRYRRALAFAMRRPVVVVSSAACLAFGGGVMAISRPLLFMPQEAATELLLSVMFPAGTDPDGLAERARSLSAAVAAVPGISSVYGSEGAEADDAARRADYSFTTERLVLVCPLEAGASIEGVRDKLFEAATASLPGIAIEIGLPPDPTARLLGLDGAAVIAVRGETREEAIARVDRFEAALFNEAGTALCSMARSPAGTKTRIVIQPRRAAAAKLGITLSDAAMTIRAATQGVKVAVLEREGQQMAVRVFAGGADGTGVSSSMDEVVNIPVTISTGNLVPVLTIASFESTEGETAFARLDRADVVYLEPRSAPGKTVEVAMAVEHILPSSIGAARSNESAFSVYGKAMAGAVILVLVLLYLTLGAQFESFSLPLIIMATIPLAMAGVGPALMFTGTGLDSGSILGLVVLFGVVVNNAILLHEASAARRLAGAGAGYAAFAGASDRVRPVLATTLTTIVALLPMCLSATGAAQRSLAIAVLGGLSASTVLTLFISPIAFAAVSSARKSA